MEVTLETPCMDGQMHSRILSASSVSQFPSASFATSAVAFTNWLLMLAAVVLCPVRSKAQTSFSQLASGSYCNHFLSINRLRASTGWEAMGSRMKVGSRNCRPRSYHCSPATSFKAMTTSRSSSSTSFGLSDISRKVHPSVS